METTDEVLKLDKSKYFKELHLKNIESIDLTDEVLKLDKSKDFKELQL